VDPDAGRKPAGMSSGHASPKAGKLRTRRRETNSKGRVHWDEQSIAEHDKERGTRQKIDEPDTPYVRSPQTASDSEGGVASSDDDRPGWRTNMVTSAKSSENSQQVFPELLSRQMARRQMPPLPQKDEQSVKVEGGSHGTGDVNPEAIADRLNDWVLSKGRFRRDSSGTASVASSDGVEAYAGDVEHSRASSCCSSRSSSSAPLAQHRVHTEDSDKKLGEKQNERRISLPEDSPQPKPVSAYFRAQRAKHYNEVAAIKAFKSRGKDSSSSSNSETSDEEKKEVCNEVETLTNTNTNKNQTFFKVNAKPTQRSRSPIEAHRGRSENSPTNRADRSVSFSGGESGNESSEEFQRVRRNHYAGEWTQDPDVPTAVSSLETNTNTNLNASSSRSSVLREKLSGRKNPMEAGRPPVQFGAGLGGDGTGSQEFLSKRSQHYDEVAVVKKFKDELEVDAEEEEEDQAEPLEESSLAGPEQASSSNSTARLADVPAESAEPDREVAEVRSAANPMEPRLSGVAFNVDDAIGVDERQGEAAQADSWRAKRKAHYNDMAAALRAMPPSSDEETDDD